MEGKEEKEEEEKEEKKSNFQKRRVKLVLKNIHKTLILALEPNSQDSVWFVQNAPFSDFIPRFTIPLAAAKTMQFESLLVVQNTRVMMSDPSKLTSSLLFSHDLL